MCISNPMSTTSASSSSTEDTGPVKSAYELPPELKAQEEKKRKRRQKSLVNFGDGNGAGTGMGTSSNGMGGMDTSNIG